MDRYYREQRKLEMAQNAKILDLYHAEAEGRYCLCGHSPAFHWNYHLGQDYRLLGRCGDASCGCEAYDENVFAGLETRDKKRRQRAEDDEDGLARAARQTESAASEAESWEQAVTAADKPRRMRKRRRQSAEKDPAVLDALRALGGEPEDLSD
jgi:hypothetical protein